MFLYYYENIFDKIRTSKQLDILETKGETVKTRKFSKTERNGGEVLSRAR